MLLELKGADDFIPVVSMNDAEMVEFTHHLSNLVPLVIRLAEVTVKTNEARARVRDGEIRRLRELARITQQQ